MKSALPLLLIRTQRDINDAVEGRLSYLEATLVDHLLVEDIPKDMEWLTEVPGADPTASQVIFRRHFFHSIGGGSPIAHTLRSVAENALDLCLPPHVALSPRLPLFLGLGALFAPTVRNVILSLTARSLWDIPEVREWVARLSAFDRAPNSKRSAERRFGAPAKLIPLQEGMYLAIDVGEGVRTVLGALHLGERHSEDYWKATLLLEREEPGLRIGGGIFRTVKLCAEGAQATERREIARIVGLY
jgi:hypothetical protein